MQREYPLYRMHYQFCPTARYVGGTSHYLCECPSPCNAAQAAKLDARAAAFHIGTSIGVYITNELYDAIENARSTSKATLYTLKQFEGMFEHPIVLTPGTTLITKIVLVIRGEGPGSYFIGDTHTYVLLKFD